MMDRLRRRWRLRRTETWVQRRPDLIYTGRPQRMTGIGKTARWWERIR